MTLSKFFPDDEDYEHVSSVDDVINLSFYRRNLSINCLTFFKWLFFCLNLHFICDKDKSNHNLFYFDIGDSYNSFFYTMSAIVCLEWAYICSRSILRFLDCFQWRYKFLTTLFLFLIVIGNLLAIKLIFPTNDQFNSQNGAFKWFYVCHFLFTLLSFFIPCVMMLIYDNIDGNKMIARLAIYEFSSWVPIIGFVCTFIGWCLVMDGGYSFGTINKMIIGLYTVYLLVANCKN
jgi:hypothetical protein